VSDASPQDISLLLEDLGMKTLVDLLSPTELKDDLTLDRTEVFGEFVSLIWYERKNGAVKELNDGEPRMKKKKSNNPLKKLMKKKGSEEEEQQEEEAALLRSAADVAEKIAECDEKGLIIEACPGDDVFLDEEDDEDEEPVEGDKKRQKRFAKVYPPGTISEDESRKDRKERHFASIINELKYVKGTVSKVRKSDIPS